MLRLNVGSGQRRFEGHGWKNIDCVSRPDQIPDIICDVTKEPLPNGADMIALIHCLEHWVLSDADTVLRECYRALKDGGELLVVVPNIKELAKAWLRGDINDYIYKVNLMGAWQGEIGDLHKWHWLPEELRTKLHEVGFNSTMPFDWRAIPGADSLMPDWWYYGVWATK